MKDTLVKEIAGLDAKESENGLSSAEWLCKVLKGELQDMVFKEEISWRKNPESI